MSQFLYQLEWIIKGYEFALLLWFFVSQWSKYSWSLFYVRGKSFKSLEHHEMHSCFMTILCMFVFHVFASEIEQFFVSPLIADLNNKIKVFYISGMIIQFIYLIVIFSYHRARQCLFSRTTRVCMYTTIAVITLQFIQLIARGYVDYHALVMVYFVAVWICNIVAVSAMSVYPIRQTLVFIKQRREAL
ncbi:hypothetical protein [Pseudoalteromonas sp. A25]|uniref:hypothetical protein n=1 Tax=Pseudoalteromonas sp. A25 TaxID=116092 RepID=UPI001261140C|nr:hypothetical protein [Pseudoalteromonas sp. A25]